jgi:hypothetical protein
VVTTTDSKSVSLQLSRFETCRTTGLFLSEHGLKIHSWTVSWEACLNLVLATLKWISQQNLNCLLDCDSAGSKPADEKFFSLSLSTLAFAHGWFRRRLVSLVLAKWQQIQNLFLLDCAGSKLAELRFFSSLETRLKDSFMDGFVERSSNWSWPSGNRFKICFSWTVQVQNLPSDSFSLSEHGLKICS